MVALPDNESMYSNKESMDVKIRMTELYVLKSDVNKLIMGRNNS